MVIPWNGFKLNQLLAEAEPMTSAKYVKFTTLFDPEQYPGQNSSLYPWPYTEGLRLDEALHPLTWWPPACMVKACTMPTALPLRLVVPWKYGFKSIKAIVRIELTETQPPTLWNTIAPQEYGFYANVNPDGGSPPLEPAHRAAYRRVETPRYTRYLMAMQPSGFSIYQHGPARQLLIAGVHDEK